MFGAFLDAAMSIPRNMQMEEDRNQRQADAWGHTQADQTFNSAEAAKQRAWAEQMSNTQYQRAAGDASAAGLNRILAMRQGGAGTPGGSTASSSSSGGTGGSPGTASSNFTAGEFNAAQGEVMEHTKRLLKEQTRSEHENIYKRYWEAATEEQKLQTEKHNTEKAKHDASIAGNSAKAYELEGEIDTTTYGKIMRYIDRSIRSITGAGSAYRNTQ